MTRLVLLSATVLIASSCGDRSQDPKPVVRTAPSGIETGARMADAAESVAICRSYRDQLAELRRAARAHPDSVLLRESVETLELIQADACR